MSEKLTPIFTTVWGGGICEKHNINIDLGFCLGVIPDYYYQYRCKYLKETRFSDGEGAYSCIYKKGV